MAVIPQSGLPGANRRRRARFADAGSQEGAATRQPAGRLRRVARRNIKTRFGSLAEVFDHAESIVPRLPIPQGILDLLYANSRCTSLSRGEWEEEVRRATAIDQCLKRLLPSREVLDQILDTETKAAVIRKLTTPRAALALGYHGGFPFLRIKLFGHLFPESVTIASSGKHAANDGAFVLFAAREAIFRGQPALMAPDGRFGKETGTITVFGARRTVADGAPFLAHSTACNTAWFAVVRTDSGFTLEIVPGPGREDREPFADYRDRFYRFYTEQIEASLTGDPRNLPINQNWCRTFAAMFAGGIDKSRRPAR